MMTDVQLENFLSNVVGFVEANSFEQMSLWKEYTKERKDAWIENLSGLFRVVGKVDGRPICISLSTAIVNQFKICFYEPTSKLVDYSLIDKWLSENVPSSARQHGRINRTNAMNFHNVFPR